MLKKIGVEDLEVGMFVADFNVPWVDHPFITPTKLLKKADDIDKIKDAKIREVYIDTEKGRDNQKAVAAQEAQDEVARDMARALCEGEGMGMPAQPEAAPPERGTAEFHAELSRATRVYEDAKEVVRGLLGDLSAGHALCPARAVEVVDSIAALQGRNGEALSSLHGLKSQDEYLFHHSVKVCILCLDLGRQMGFTAEELRRLGIGAILHDVGKTKIPEAVYNKPGDLTEREFTLVKTHALHGAKMILASKELPDECAAVALDHHERFHGGGYPRKLQGRSIGKFGLIAAIADVYDAITSDRVYRRGVPGYLAVQKIYEWSKNNEFYPVYAQKFIQRMGIYPVGTVVRLDTGEVAVVVAQSPAKLLRPRVRIVAGPTGKKLAEPFDVSLAEEPGATGQRHPRSIERPLAPEAASIDAEEVLRRALGGGETPQCGPPPGFDRLR